MNIQLLDRTRRLLKVIEGLDSDKYLMQETIKELKKNLCSEVVLLDRVGYILETAFDIGTGLNVEKIFADKKLIDDSLNERLLSVLSVRDNVNLATMGIEACSEGTRCMIIPVIHSKKRYGTLLFFRRTKLYDIEDIVIAQQATLIIGMELSRYDISLENEAGRKRVTVKLALDKLTKTELKAMKCVFGYIALDEGQMFINHIAAENGFSRTSVISGLNKLRDYGIIAYGINGQNSAGGTYVKILDNMPLKYLLQLY